MLGQNGLAATVQDRMKGGENVAQMLKRAKFTDLCEFRGIKGVARQAIQYGDFEHSERYSKVPFPDFVAKAIKDHEGSDTPHVARVAARLALQQTAAGERGWPFDIARGQAEGYLLTPQRLQQTPAAECLPG